MGMKVVINRCYGGFGLSKEAYIRYGEIKGTPVWIEEDTKYKALGIFTAWTVPPDQRPANREDEFYSMDMDERKEYNESYSKNTIYCRDIARNDPALVQLVEEMGDAANGKHAELAIVEIPDGVQFEVEEYDGKEWVSEVHRTWY
jgi:hypothetical protein